MINKKRSKSIIAEKDNGSRRGKKQLLLLVHNKEECDPSKISPTKKYNDELTNKQDGEADVGILGCGYDQYCMESEYSKLGGFCVAKEHEDHHHHHQQEEEGVWDHRQMTLEHQEEDFHRELSPSFEFECSEEDFPSGRITTRCGTDRRCLPYCGNETCVKPTFKIERSDDYYRYDFCYSFSGPIALSTCFYFRNTTHSDKDNSLSCAFLYHYGFHTAPLCNTCAVNEQGCIYFDCRNIQIRPPFWPGGIGSTCDENGTYPHPHPPSNSRITCKLF